MIGASEIKQLSDIKDELSSSAGDLSEEAVKAMMEAQAGSEATFNELKKSLAELPALLAPEKDETDGQPASKPLVVIIDELDRCRPDFALGVLETLKHFFRADGVHFVLVTHSEHLRLSVQNRYGVGEAAQEYLQKFYDFIIHFESSFEDHRGPNSAILARRQLDEIMPDHVNEGERHELGELIKAIAAAFNLTLRQVEGIVTNVTLAYLAVREREFRPRALICFLALLKALRPDIYQKIKTRRFVYDEFRAFLASGKWPDNFNQSYVLDLFRYHGDPNLDPNDPEFSGFGPGLYRYGFGDRLDVLPYMANAIMDRFGKA